MIIVTGFLLVLLIIFLAIIGILLIPIRYSLEASSYTPYRVEWITQWFNKGFFLRFLLEEDKPFIKEMYIMGKAKFGPAKDYEEWLVKRVKEETEEDTVEDDALWPEEDPFDTLPDENKVDTEKETLDLNRETSDENQDKTEKGSTETSKEESSDSTETETSSSEKKKSDKWWLPYVTQLDLYKAIIRLLSRIYNHSKPRYLSIEGCFGTGDPFQVGVLSGMMYAIWPQHMQKVSFSFVEVCYEGKIVLKGKIVPLYIVWYALCFIFTKVIRRFIIAAVKHVRGGK